MSKNWQMFLTDSSSAAGATLTTSSCSEINMINITVGSDRQCKPMLQKSHGDNGDIHIVNTSRDPQPLLQEDQIFTSDSGLYSEDILNDNLKYSLSRHGPCQPTEGKIMFPADHTGRKFSHARYISKGTQTQAGLQVRLKWLSYSPILNCAFAILAGYLQIAAHHILGISESQALMIGIIWPKK